MEIFIFTSNRIIIRSLYLHNAKTINLIDELCKTNNLIRDGVNIDGSSENLYQFMKELTEYVTIILE